jgi:ribosome-binding factor A
MTAYRTERLNEQFRREITEILRTEVRDPRVALASVAGVAVTPDLWLARVFVQLKGDADERAETLRGLDSAAPYIRRLLGDRLHMRRIPELRFVADETAEKAGRVEEILRGLRREVDVSEGSGEEEE